MKLTKPAQAMELRSLSLVFCGPVGGARVLRRLVFSVVGTTAIVVVAWLQSREIAAAQAKGQDKVADAIARLQDPDPLRRRIAAEWFVYHGDDRALPHLSKALGDPDWTVRRVAAEAIAARALKGISAAPALEAAFRQPMPIAGPHRTEAIDARATYLIALTNIGTPPATLIPLATAALGDPNEPPEVHNQACYALGILGPRALAAETALAAALGRPGFGGPGPKGEMIKIDCTHTLRILQQYRR